MHLAYWHWLIFGMLLILFELFVPSFTLLWFGISALIVGGLLALSLPLSLTIQILTWAILSILCLIAWFKLIKPRAIDRTTAGLSRESVVGERGLLIKAPAYGSKGEVRFTIPLLGNDTWPCISRTPLKAGDYVRVTDIMGNALLVEQAQRDTVQEK